MKKTILVAMVAGFSMVSAQAFAAECNDDQQAEAGMVAANISKNVVSKVVPVTGKQMVNISACDVRAGTYSIEYKYNFLGADGLYWIEASARFGAGGANSSVKVSKASPNMAAAEAKAGVKLASN